MVNFENMVWNLGFEKRSEFLDHVEKYQYLKEILVL